MLQGQNQPRGGFKSSSTGLGTETPIAACFSGHSENSPLSDFTFIGNSNCKANLLKQLQLQQKQMRYYSCRKGCGQEIYFDANSKSQSGKWIPLSKDTGLPHQFFNIIIAM
jgi:hypothetical protein